MTSGRLAVVGTLSTGSPGAIELFESLSPLAGSQGVDVFGSVDGVLPPTVVRIFRPKSQADLVGRLRPYSGVITDPSLYSSPSEEAETIQLLANTGIPTAGTVGNQIREVVGAELADLVGSATVDDLVDPDRRERLSVRMRRLSPTRSPLEPSVSLILSTNRPEFISHALKQARSQEYPNLELVLVAHGDGFPDDDRVASPYDRHLKIIRVPEAVTFGGALNEGVNASSGSLIAKMDDDDWYGRYHIDDLVDAMRYSGVDLVAKAAEFVYLEALDITIRRMSVGQETFNNRNVAGGTFLIARETLHQVGGWRSVVRHVDQMLLDDMERHGLPWYRTHGYGYVLHRRPSGHTWDAGVDYFLDHSETQYRGLELGASMAAD